MGSMYTSKSRLQEVLNRDPSSHPSHHLRFPSTAAQRLMVHACLTRSLARSLPDSIAPLIACSLARSVSRCLPPSLPPALRRSLPNCESDSQPSNTLTVQTANSCIVVRMHTPPPTTPARTDPPILPPCARTILKLAELARSDYLALFG